MVSKFSKPAFTIVELLVVIIVIAVLVTLAVIGYSGISSKATVTTLQSDLSNAKKQLLAFQASSSSNVFPTAINCVSPSSTEICIKSTGSNTFSYTPYTGTTPSFYLTATNGTNTYTITESTNPLTQSSTVTNGLVLNLDAGNTASYPGSGTTWTDLSGNNNNGTLLNGVGYSSSNGGALTFDGVDDYVNVISTPTQLQGNPSITVSGWFNRISSTHGGNTGLWGIGGNATDAGINSWWSSNVDDITIDMWGRSTFTTGVKYPINQWVYVTWQKYSGAMSRANSIIWVNLDKYTGNQLTLLRGEGPVPNINNNGITVGRIYPTYSTSLGFRIGGFSVYNRVLSSSEITQNFNALRGRYGI